MLIAHITDTHIKLPSQLAYGRVDTAAMLARCVDHIRKLDPQPDLLVVTGDLVDRGLPQEYAYFQKLMRDVGVPMVVIAGNHDEREAMRAAFAADGYLPPSGFLHFCLEGTSYPLRIIGLDTLVPLQGGGALCAQRLAWLDSTLSEQPGQPTLVMMHHPPFVTGIEHMDQIGLVGREAFAQIVSRHPQIELILCGHLHRSIHTQVCGRRVLTCPSPAHQVALALGPGAPSTFQMETPGYMLHWWTGKELVSHTVAIGDFAGPYPFFDATGELID